MALSGLPSVANWVFDIKKAGFALFFSAVPSEFKTKCTNIFSVIACFKYNVFCWDNFALLHQFNKYLINQHTSKYTHKNNSYLYQKTLKFPSRFNWLSKNSHMKNEYFILKLEYLFWKFKNTWLPCWAYGFFSYLQQMLQNRPLWEIVYVPAGWATLLQRLQMMKCYFFITLRGYVQ